MPSDQINEQQAFLFVISGGTPMTLTRNVPESDHEKPNCPDCIDEAGISTVNTISLSWIGHAARTIQRIIDELRKRAPRATVSVVTCLGGFETQLQSVPIQSEEQIEISLSSIETMAPSEPCFTNNLFEYLTKMNVASVHMRSLKKSTPRPDGSQFDQMYLFMCEEDLSTASLANKSFVTLAPIVRWFIIGPNNLRASLNSLKRRFAPVNGDFDIFQSEDTVADNLIDRLLPPPEEKPLLALGAKSAKFVIDSSSGVRSIEVLGFMPLGNVSSSNLSQFSFEDDFIYDIGQDPDYDETESCKGKFDIDGDYFGSFHEPEQQLLPTLLTGMMEESLAAFCQVSLKEHAEYLLIKQALASLEEPSGNKTKDGSNNAMEIDDEKDTSKNEKQDCYFPPDEVQEVDSDEGPSDDDDIDDIIDEAEGKTIRLKLALLSPAMTRPGWPDMDQWTSEFKPFKPAEKPQFWHTDKYVTKTNPWLDERCFTGEVMGPLSRIALRLDTFMLRKAVIELELEVNARCMNLELVHHVLEKVAESLPDEEAKRLVYGEKQLIGTSRELGTRVPKREIVEIPLD